MHFPLPILPTMNWRGGRGFGSDRSGVAIKLGIPGGVLRHGAVDLIAKHGTPVLAIDDGEVLCDPYEFFFGTYAIEVEHPQFIARYCEIAPQTLVRRKSRVKSGQMIGRVGNQPGADMLHLELFDGSASGPLTTSRTKANQPYYRRKDLIDPTPLMDELAPSVRGFVERDMKVTQDADGRSWVQAQRANLLDI